MGTSFLNVNLKGFDCAFVVNASLHGTTNLRPVYTRGEPIMLKNLPIMLCRKNLLIMLNICAYYA